MLLLGMHLGHFLPNLRSQPVHLCGQGLVLGHNAFYLVKNRFRYFTVFIAPYKTNI